METRQQKISDIFESKTATTKRHNQVSTAIARMIAIDMLPLSFAEGRGFRDLIKKISPNYAVPSRNTILKHIDLMYDSEKRNLLNVLGTAEHVALTTDCWTSRSNDSYLTVTIHFLTTEWNHKSFVLDTSSTVERHTSENLAEALQQIISDWKLDEKVTAVVHDNAANIVNACSTLQAIDENISCFAHSLQLVVGKALDIAEVKNLVNKCSSVVGHFKHSTVACNALKLKQQQLNLPEHKLIQAVKTRWNSVYFMLQRLMEQREAVTAVLGDRNFTSRQHTILYEMTVLEWETISEITGILHPFQVSTTLLSSETTPTLSIIHPLIKSLLNNFLTGDNSENSGLIRQIKTTLETELKRRFKVNNPVAGVEDICTFLDPRYKNQERVAGIIAKVKRHLQDVINVENETCTVQQLKTRNPEEGAKATALSILFPEDSQVGCSMSELDNYAQEQAIKKYNCPLTWWQTHQDTYPKLSLLARKYLSIPATSTPSERIFSTAGNIVSAKRNCLDPKNVNKLIFLNFNCKC